MFSLWHRNLTETKGWGRDEELFCRNIFSSQSGGVKPPVCRAYAYVCMCLFVCVSTVCMSVCVRCAAKKMLLWVDDLLFFPHPTLGTTAKNGLHVCLLCLCVCHLFHPCMCLLSLCLYIFYHVLYVCVLFVLMKK